MKIISESMFEAMGVYLTREGDDELSKLYFRYGTMGSSKSARLIMDAFEYREREEEVIAFKPVTDVRSGSGLIESRTGMSLECVDIGLEDNLFNTVLNSIQNGHRIACIFVDESQFLTFTQVVQLRTIVDVIGIPVMCYGLKSDFRGDLFEGSKALFEYANRFEEVKTICRVPDCKKKAMFNVRFKNGKPVFVGRQVKIGDTATALEDEEYYVVKCSRHFFEDYMAFNKENGL